MRLVFFLEEPSAKALLEGLMPRLVAPELEVQYVVFEGKQDLEKNLARKLSGYLAPNARFVVLRDQDGADCRAVKARLVALVEKSGKSALVRVACRELESWVLGDLAALAEEFDEPRLASHASKAKFRAPDELGAPVQELRRLVPSYQKIDGARRMGRRLNPEANQSTSFRVFCRSLKQLVAKDG